MGIFVQLKRCMVSCSLDLQSGHDEFGYVCGSILCLYVKKRGDLFVPICANVRLIFLGRFSSDLLTVGASLFRILLGGLSVRNFCTIEVCIVLRFCLMFSGVTVVGSVGMI